MEPSQSKNKWQLEFGPGAQYIQRLVRASEDFAVLTMDPNGIITGWFGGAEKMMGYAENEIVGHNFSEIFLPKDVSAGAPEAELGKAEKHGLSEDERWHTRKDGSQFFVSGIVSSILDDSGEVQGFVKVMRDVTERVRTQEALRRSEERFRLLMDGVKDFAIIMLDPEGRVTSWNAGAERLKGYRESEILGSHFSRFFENEDVERGVPKQLLKKTLIEGRVEEENWRIRKDGSRFLAGTVLTAIFDDSGILHGFAEVTRDITENKRLVDESHRHAAELEAVFQAIPDALYIGNENGITKTNTAALEMLGFDSEAELNHNITSLGEIIKTRWGDTGEPVPPGQQPFEMALAGQANVHEIIIRHLKTGLDRILRSAAAPIWFQGRIIGAVAVNTDITEKKKEDERKLQSQKLESIGRLAGGVAHEINNMLTVVNGYSDLLVKQVGEDNGMRPLLLEIRKSGERAARLTSQLLAFGRKQFLAAREINLNQIIRSMEKWLQPIIGEDVRIVTSLDPDLQSANVDPSQMEQVIFNLAINAREAMPTGGQLTIETSNVHLDEFPLASQIAVPVGDYVLLTITDTGIGMDASVQEKLFEPFFSTKVQGGGSTGLGLSSAYGIVRQSGGNIIVRSDPGKGSAFLIYLPAFHDRERIIGNSAEISKHNGMEARDSTETVLLVEDEESVRKYVSTILRMKGYNVLEANDGIEALSIHEQHKGQINILVTDVIMPRLGGAELAKRLWETRGNLEVLFISGYTDESVVSISAHPSKKYFLGKPFTPHELINKVRHILDETGDKAKE